jgi:hypothetical protein
MGDENSMSGTTKAHKHTALSSDGGFLETTETGVTNMSEGSMGYYDSSSVLTEISAGSENQVLAMGATIPAWSTLSGVALTRTLKQTSTFQSTTSTSLVDCTWSSHTLQSGSGICIAAATCQSESTAAGYLAFDFATDGTQPETWMGKPSNDLLNSCNTSMSTTLGGQVAILRFRAQSGTAKMQSDSGYISMVNYLEIS